METMGKVLVGFGILLAVVGGALWLLGRSGMAPLPGDIVVQRKNVTFYFPVVTCLAISAVLTLVAWLVRR